ncbi:MAG: hypothetical protein AAF938_22330 [Myxococcota bacterium]
MCIVSRGWVCRFSTVLFLAIFAACGDDDGTTEPDASVRDADVSDSAGADADDLAVDAANDEGLADERLTDDRIVDGDTMNDANADSASDAGTDAAVDSGVVPPTRMTWDGTLPDGVCTPDGFCVATPLPTALGMMDAWGAAEDDVWVVGQAGAILHYDGTKFVGVIGRGSDMERVHGCASDDVWALQGARNSTTGNPDGLLMEAMVLRWNGERWSVVEGAPSDVRDLHCLGTDDVWALTSTGIQRFDGTTWSTVDTGFSTVPNTLASDGATIWATGRTTGGDTLTVEARGVDIDVRIQASGPVLREIAFGFGALWGVGEAGVFEYVDGAWQSRLATVTGLESIGVSSLGMLADGTDFAAWSNGVDGWSRASRLECEGADRLRVRGVGERYWYAFRTLEQFNAAEQCAIQVRENNLERMPARPYDTRSLTRLIGADEFLVVGDRGVEVLDARSGEQSALAAFPDAVPSLGFVGLSDARDVWAAADGSQSQRFDGTEWTAYRTVTPQLTSVAEAAGVAWGVGQDRTLSRWTEGEGWMEVEYPEPVFVVSMLGADLWLTAETHYAVLVDDEWQRLPQRHEGERVVLVGSAGANRAWARTASALLRSTITTWETVLEQTELPESCLETTVLGADGDEVWCGGARWNGVDEWVQLRTGLGLQYERTEVRYGQVWAYEVEGRHAVRRDL